VSDFNFLIHTQAFFLDSMTLEDGINRLSQNVGKELRTEISVSFILCHCHISCPYGLQRLMLLYAFCMSFKTQVETLQ
jgi:hypothetical protein